MIVRAAALLCSLLLTLVAVPVQAAVCTFSNASGGNWADPGNWSGCGTGTGNPAGTPGLSDTAIIDSIGGPVVLLSEGAAAGELQISSSTVAGPGPLIMGNLVATNATFEGADPLQNPSSIPMFVSGGSIAGTFSLIRRQLRLTGPNPLTINSAATLSAVSTAADLCAGSDDFADFCITDSGTLVINGPSGQLDLGTLKLVNDGILRIESAVTLAFDTLPNSSIATVRLNGGTLDPSGEYEFQHGLLTGTGVIQGPLSMLGGTVDPGAAGTAGLISVVGQLTLGISTRAIFDIYDESGAHDTLGSTGQVFANGVIETRSALSSASASFTLITPGSTVGGTPSALNAFPLSHELDVSANDIELRFLGVQVCSWIGTNGPYTSPSNWSNCGGGTPATGDSIRINTASAVVNIGAPTSVGRVQVAGGAQLNLNSSLTVDDYFDFTDGSVTGTGTLTLGTANEGRIGGVPGTRQLTAPVVNNGSLVFASPFRLEILSGVSNNGSMSFAGVPFDESNHTFFGSGSLNNNGDITLLQNTAMDIEIAYSQTSAGTLNLDTSADLRANTVGSFGGTIGSSQNVAIDFFGASWTQQSGSEIEVNGQFVLNTNTVLQGTFYAQGLFVENGFALNIDTAGFSVNYLGGNLDSTITANQTANISILGTLGSILGTNLNIVNEWVIQPNISPTRITGSVDLAPTAVFSFEGKSELVLQTGADLTVGGNWFFLMQNPADPTGSAKITMNTGSAMQIGGQVDLEIDGRLDLMGPVRPVFGPGSSLVIEQGATLTLDGGSGTQDIGQAVLRGNGTIVGDIINNVGVVSPGLFDTGLLTITGDYSQTSGGRIDLELGSPARAGRGLFNDRLDVSGAANFGGIVNIVQVGGFDPAPLSSYGFINYASQTGSFDTTNFPPGFDDTHQMVVTPTAYRMEPDGGGGPFDCTWNVANGDWNVASNWSCGQVPGAADTARILGADDDVALVGNRAVAVLEFTAGRLGGDGMLTVTSQLTWNGGTVLSVDPANDGLVLDTGATGSFGAGGARELRNSHFRNLGTLNWTAGDLTLFQTGTLFDNLGTLNFDAGAGTVTISSDGAPNVVFHHLSGATALNKNGSGDVVFAANLDVLNGALTQINAGRLVIGSDGIDIGQYVIGAGATLEFNVPGAQVRMLNSPASITGDSTGILKKAGIGSLEIGGSVFDGAPITQVASGFLQFSSEQTLSRTQLNFGTLSNIGSTLTFTTELQWQGGQLDMLPGGIATLGVGATADLGGGAKMLNRARLQLNGSTSWTAGDLQLSNSAQVIVNSGQTLTLNNATPIQVQAAAGGQFDVFGTLIKNGVAPLRFVNLAPDGTGLFQVNEGVLDLGAHVGAMVASLEINAPGALALTSATPRTFGPGVNFTGNGQILPGPGSTTTFQGSMASGLSLLLTATATVNADFAAMTTLNRIDVDGGSTLQGSADLSVSDLNWDSGGTIGGAPGTTLTVTGGASSLVAGGAGTHVLTQRSLQIAGNLRWQDGDIDALNQAQIIVLEPGLFRLQRISGTSVLRCTTGCATPQVVDNRGVIDLDSPSGSHQFAAAVSVANAATAAIVVTNNRLDIDGTLNNAGLLFVETGATLGKTTVGTFDLGSGILAGNGTVAASVVTSSGAIIAPTDATFERGRRRTRGGGIGTLTITGNLDQSSGFLEVAVNGPGVGQFDQVIVTGNVTPGPVDAFGAGLTAGQHAAFITHATRSGPYVSLVVPGGDTFAFDNTLTTETRLVPAGPAVCTWDHTVAAASAWETLARWSCGRVPGPGDTAVFDNPEDMATLTQAVTVGTLDLQAGRISGDFGFIITDNFLWSGGEFAATTTAISTRVQSGGNAMLSGGQKTATTRDIQLLADATWTTGLIELKDGGRLTIGNGTTFTTNPGPADEFIIGTGATDGELNNAGLIRKIGVNTAGTDFHVQYGGTGGVTVEGGNFRMKGPGTYSGAFNVDAGALLEFSEANKAFPASSSVTGAGVLRIGDAGAIFSSNTFAGGFNPTGVVRVENGELEIAVAGVNLPTLELRHPNAVVNGGFDFTVGTSLVWDAGTIAAGTGGVRVLLPPTATADLTVASSRLLDVRQLVNQGNINYGGGELTLANGAGLRNEATLTVNLASDATFVEGGAGTELIHNTSTGLLRKQGLAQLSISEGSAGLGFLNEGQVNIEQGTLRLGSDQTESGNYAMGDPISLLVVNQTATRTFNGNLSGLGGLRVEDAAVVTLRGSFTAAAMTTADSGAIDSDVSGSLVNLSSLVVSGGELSGADDFNPSFFSWTGGTITGISESTLTLAGSGTISSAGLKVLEQREILITGALDWQDGDIELRSDGRFQVTPTGTFDISVASNVGMDCKVGCTSVGVTNFGTVHMAGIGEAFLNNVVDFENRGLLEVSAGTFYPGNLMTEAGSIVDIHSAGTLRRTAGNNVLIDDGVLRGNGTIIADNVVLSGLATMTPNAGGPAPAIGTFTIGGNFDHEDAELEIDINGASAGQFDLVQVLGTVTPGPVQPAGSGIANGESVSFIVHSNRLGDYIDVVGTSDYVFSNYLLSETRLVRVGNLAYEVDRSDDPVSPLPGDEACTAAPNDCTLRGAINAANSNPNGIGPDLITFAIPGTPGQLHQIMLTSALPPITEDVEFDATTQDGFVANSQPTGALDLVPKVQLVGSGLAGPNDAGLLAQGALIALRGMAIVDFEKAVVTDNGALEIYASFIGMAADGSTGSTGCLTAVEVGNFSFAGVGGPTPEDRNLIAGCATGIDVIGTDSFVTIDGNLIGTNASATNSPVGQLNGVRVAARCGLGARSVRGIFGIRVEIGNPGSGNVIVGQDVGVRVEEPFGLNTIGNPCGPSSARVSVDANDIGVLPGGLPPVRNRIGFLRTYSGPIADGGVTIGLPGNTAHANRIFHSLESGIVVMPGTEKTLVGVNAFSGNAGLAVDLRPDATPGEANEPTANDVDDADTGPNRLHNFARIVSLSGSSSIDVTYNVDTVPANSAFDLEVDFYLNDNGQTITWLGNDTYTATDAATGNKSISLTGVLPPGAELLTIVTDADGNSSELSFVRTGLSIVSVLPEPANLGMDRTVTGQIIAADGEPYFPSGTVTATDGTDSCAPAILTPATPGVVDFSCVMPTTGAAGARSISVTYTPDDRMYQGSSTVIASNVLAPNIATATTIISINPQPSQPGQILTLTVEVSSASGAPTGTVSVAGASPFKAETCLATLAASGPNTSTGSCTITPTIVGLRNYVATYLGVGSFDSSVSAPAPQVVQGTASFGSVTQSVDTTAVGEVFQVTVTVGGNGPIPTGMVSVTPLPLGNAQTCSLQPVAQQTFSSCTVDMISPVAVGKVLIVRYQGSADLVYPPVQTVLTHNTTRAPTAVTITADTPDPSNAKQPVTVQFSVTSTIAAAVSPFAPLNGSVTVTDGLDSCTANVTAITTGTSTTGSCVLILQAAGVRQLVATYQGNENFAGADSPAEPHTVAGVTGADLGISIRNFRQVVNAGGELEYVIEVINSGTSVAANSRVVTALPAQMSNVTWTCAPTAPSQCPGSGVGSIDRLVDLSGGGRVTFRLRGLVQGAEGPITAAATVTPATGVNDPDPNNNTDTDTDVIGIFADGLEDLAGE